jgi:hypothetical protein
MHETVTKRGAHYRRAFLFVFSLVVLTASVTVVVLPRFLSKAEITLQQRLAQVVPQALPGWAVKELPIADSPEMLKRVESILEYDDAIFRTYQKEALEVQVYVAYWRPGSVPYGQAGAHTPDTCWIYNGWTCSNRLRAQARILGPSELVPYEFGVFSKTGQTLEVIFWHLVGGKPYGYIQEGWRSGVKGYMERLPRLLDDVRAHGLNLAQEQIVIRISTNGKLEQLWADSDFIALMGQLRPLGIFQGQDFKGGH